MNATPPREEKGEGQPRLDRREQGGQTRATAAREVAQLLAKGVRALRLYHPTNPAVRRFGDELGTILSKALEGGKPLSLVVLEEALLFDGEPVYTDTDRTHGLPFRLYQDGIREVTFRPGLEPEEIRAFLAALRAGLDARRGEDDLVTLLWQHDLPHIGYGVVDELTAEEGAPQESADPVRLLRGEADRGETRQGGSPTAVAPSEARPGADTSGPRTSSLPPAPTLLSPEMLASLQTARGAEESQPGGERLADLLLDLTAVAEECEDYPVILELLNRAVTAAVERGDLAWATGVFWELRTLAGLGEVLPAVHRDAIGQTLARMGGEAAAAPLGTLINNGHVQDPEVLAAYIQVLADEAIPALCDVLGELTDRRDRRILCSILARRAEDRIPLLAKGLNDPRWYVVRNVAFILGRTGNPEAVAPLRRVLNHPEPRVVREALHSLEALDMHRAHAFIASLLESPSRLVQVWAIEKLATLKDADIVPKLLAMVQAADFEERPFEERQRLFEALGRAGTDDLLPTLQKMLVPSRLLGRARVQERQRCAIAALGALGTPEAKALLNDGLQRGDEALAAAFQAALAGRREAAEEAKEEW